MTTRLTELAVSTTGNIIGGNVVANVVLTNNFQYANGQPFSGNVNYSNANVAAFLPTYTGDLSANNVTVGTVYSPNFYGNAVIYTNATGYLASTNLFKYNPGTETLTVGSASLTGNVSANIVTVLVGNITNLDSLNFTVENISALVGNNGVNIGAGGNNNLVVLPTEVLIQNVPLSAAGNIMANGNITANYFIGDGSQLTNLPSGGGNTGNVTFSDQTVIGTGTNDGYGGLYLAPGNASIANSAVQYLRVRGGDYPTHIHFDTGNTAYYDQYFGDDNKYVKLEAGYSGNIVIGTNSLNWTFDNTGNVTLPANCVIRTPIGSNGNIVLKPSNSGLVVIKGGTSPLLLIQSDVANTQNRIEIDNFGSANNIGGTFVGRYSRGTLSAPTAVQAGDQLASFKGKGYDGSAFSNPVAQISVEAFDNWTLGNVPSRLSFYTTGYNDGSNPILNMTISPTGNVDILNGNLIVSGGGGYLQGNTVTGNDGLYAGSANFTPLGSNVVAQFGANSNSYSQINFQNINDGSLASTDYILTANNGDDTTYFVDLGITSNNHSDSAFFGDTSTANDAYLYVVASAATGPSGTGTGNLILGSTNGNIKMFVGNTAQANVVQTISSTGVDIVGNVVADNVLVTASIGVSGVASPAPTISGFGSINSVNFSATGNVTANGYVSVTGNVTGGNIVTSGSGGNIILTGGNITGAHIVVTTPTALANLTAVAGGRAFINNANLVAAGNFGNQVGSGGSNVVPVWSDGSNWYVG